MRLVCWGFSALFLAIAASGQTVDRPMHVGGSVSPPRLISKVDARYPHSLWGKRKEGEVVVGIVVDENGVPQKVHILRSFERAFDEAAMEAVAQYHFAPAMKDGLPVAVEMNVAVDFQLVRRP